MGEKSFGIRTIRVEAVLGDGTFSSGGNAKVVEGLAVDVQVVKPGLPQKNSASVKIWGMRYEDMAALTTLAFKPLESRRNELSVRAGRLGSALSLVFSGEIASAFADFNSAPDVCMVLEADSGSWPQKLSSRTVVVEGETQASQLFEQWAKEAGYAFKNEGLTASVRDSWHPGSPIQKMEKLAKDIGCELIVDDSTVIVMPAGQARSGETPLLSKDSGLIGYPTFTQDGISLRCLYDPAIEFGGLVRVESIVPKASGTWKVTKISHHLSAYVSGSSAWESTIEGIAQ